MAHRHPAGCQRLGRFSLAVVADLDDAASATFAPTSVSSQIGFSLVAAFGWYLSRDCVLDVCAGVSGSRVWSPFARVSVAAAGPRSLSCSGWCAAATRSLMPPAPGFRDGAPISTKGASARRRSGWRSGEPSGPGPSYLMSCGIGSRQGAILLRRRRSLWRGRGTGGRFAPPRLWPRLRRSCRAPASRRCCP